MGTMLLNTVMKDFSQLPLEDKQYAVEVMEKQLIDAKRDAIAMRAKKAMANLKKGAVKKGTIQELYEDLESA